MMTELPKAVSSRIATWFQSYYADIKEFEVRIAPALHQTFANHRRVTLSSADSDAIRREASRFLLTHPSSDGAGVAFNLALLEPANAQLEWWVRDGHDFIRTDFVLIPGSTRFYNYESLTWFRTPFDEGHPAISGPYIDYLGVDHYICTFTVPLNVNGRRIGVVGTDVRMDTLERALISMLATLERGAAILSNHNQVLVGSSGELSTGVLVAAIPPGFAQTPIDVPNLGLKLLYRI